MSSIIWHASLPNMAPSLIWQAGHFKMVQKLLELKGNTLLKSRSSALAVTIAAEEGRVDVIKALLAHRREEQIDFSAYDSGRTPLLVASQ